MNTRQLAHFLAVLEHGSILRASRDLNISQPALSKSIAALEEHFGQALFTRLSRGVQPTAFGLVLQRHARRIITDVEAARDALAILARGSVGRVAAGVGSSFVPVVGDTIWEISATRPEVDFTIMTDHADHLRNALLGSQIDVFVGMCNHLVDNPAFEIEPVFSDRFIGVCGRDHPLAGRQVEPNDLLRYEWIVPELEEAGRAALEAYFVSNGLKKPRFKIVTNSDLIVIQFLRGSRLLSILPEANLRLQGFATLARLHPRGFNFQRKVGIVRRAKMVSTPLLDHFVAVLTNRLSAMGQDIGVRSAA